jgi:threonine aldolase
MNFRSDTSAPAAPEILAALAEANEGRAPAYGEDRWSQALEAQFSELFERPVRVFPVATGTAANAIALASLVSPWGAVLAHREGHAEVDECGAPEFYSGGAKLVLMDGPGAKVTPAALEEAAMRNARGVHSVKPMAATISQASERGTVYRPEEVAALGAAAKRLGLKLHMDGARFANALAHLKCAPADVTWRAGVDVLSFGATKNGAFGAEAIVAFDDALAERIERLRKRGGHLHSKSRFLAAQLGAYVADGLWLKLAARANGLARRIGEAAGDWVSVPVESNHVFIKPGAEKLAALRAAGAEFYDWGPAGAGEARLVVSWNQSEDEVEAFCALLRATL